MVSMPFISALQTQQVATSKTTTTSVQPSNPTVTITAADIANINSISSLANDLSISLSNNPGSVTPEQMIKMVQLTKLLRTVLNYLGYTDGDITQLSIKALKDKGYTVDAASFNQKLQAVLNLNPELISSSPMAFGDIMCSVLIISFSMCKVIMQILSILYIFPILGTILIAPFMLLCIVLLDLWLDNCAGPPPGTGSQTIGCSACGDATGSVTPMTSN